MRHRGVYREGKWFWDDEIPEVKPRGFVIEDTIDPLKHPADGRMYTSKSAFRATTRAAGYEEVGNEKLESKPVDNRPAMEQSIRTAIELQRTIEGKSEGERREIEARVLGHPLEQHE